MNDQHKTIIYQVLPRLFGNRNLTRKFNGTLAENGVGKMNDFTPGILKSIHEFGVSCIWYTGVLRHATSTDYTSFRIPSQHASIVKGRAGSPYAIADYYDIDPDLAVDVDNRIEEFENLVRRTHESGMKVIIDFVGNHVAREYQSVMKPQSVRDLGEDDNKNEAFNPQNNFYYCVGKPFKPQFELPAEDKKPYRETPAKATGNDRFDPQPTKNDWYETVKLNYGIDYMAFDRPKYFDPIPNTWQKMTDILIYWCEKGVDGFRCDMAEMVPPEFWKYAIGMVRVRFPHVVFIAEVYNPSLYRCYLKAGFDYLYDKVGMYDCLRAVTRGERAASDITDMWQRVDNIHDHMLYFLENHDEQRVASDFFSGVGSRAIPALIVSAMLRNNPFMFYFGQEFGERGLDKEGFSGMDGRTTIFDYWTVDSIYRGYFSHQLTGEEKKLCATYKKILHLVNTEEPLHKGKFFDLMYVNPSSKYFDSRHHFAFLRHHDKELLLIVANFSGQKSDIKVNIPAHAFDVLHMQEEKTVATDLLSGEKTEVALRKNGFASMTVGPYSGRVYKMTIR